MDKQLMLTKELEEEKLRREVEELRDQCNKVRKGIYAKHAELNKKYLDVFYELEHLKVAMCKTGARL